MHRGKLEQNLKQLGFTAVLHFKPSTDVDEAEEGQGSQVGAEAQRGKSKNLKDKFKRDIVERCRDGAIVFVFISGVQFPFHVSWLSEGSKERSLITVTFTVSFVAETCRRSQKRNGPLDIYQ